MKRIYFTVTNDLTYDQRMQRICTSLAENGYEVTLVGYNKPTSLPFVNKKYKQKRIHCWFLKGKSFYTEYNVRLFLYLLFKKINQILTRSGNMCYDGNIILYFKLFFMLLKDLLYTKYGQKLNSGLFPNIKMDIQLAKLLQKSLKKDME